MKRIFLILFSVFTIKKSVAQYSVDSTVNTFVDAWIGKPYKFGGESRRGIDCSALVQLFYKTAFGFTIPRTCVYQYKQCEKILSENLKIGDILFFKSKLSPSGWHCGIFIGDNKFLHAANRAQGVIISFLTETRYAKNIIGIGRFNN
jgi:lipoprotein Spr